MTESEDQISPRAITECDLCRVPNGAIGGRDADHNFYPAYLSEGVTKADMLSKLGRRQWCGKLGPEKALTLIRIVCEPVEVDGQIENLCQRCAREIARESQEAAA